MTIFSLVLFLHSFSSFHFMSFFFFFFLSPEPSPLPFSFFFSPFFLFCHFLCTFSITFFFLVHLGHCHWDRLSPWRSLIMISLFFFFLFFLFFVLWIPCDCDYGWAGSFSNSFFWDNFVLILGIFFFFLSSIGWWWRLVDFC